MSSAYTSIQIPTSGERFYSITEQVQNGLHDHIREVHPGAVSGVVHLFMPHTSCALTVSEAFDPSAARDMENFLKHLAPRNLPFIEHTAEGPDDSPSHMKSILLQQSLSLIVDQGKLILGTWGGIYLCEFRDSPKSRNVLLKYQPDLN